MRIVYIIFLLFFCINHSQVRKSIEAYRFQNPPVIDGKLNEKEWQKIKAADGFTLMRPETRHGEEIPSEYETKAFIGYDDKAIYLGAQLNHPDPQNIPKEFGRRDWGVFSKSEAFWVSLDTFDDKLNSFGFAVSSAGTIADLYTSGDFNFGSLWYDTVFDAKVQINDKGWSLEMVIPYSAIRFPKNDIQSWGLNFARKFKIKKKIINYSNVKYTEKKILIELKKNKIKLICLAGFMKILSENFIKKSKLKILNIHPSLLPKYKGLNTHMRALANQDNFFQTALEQDESTFTVLTPDGVPFAMFGAGKIEEETYIWMLGTDDVRKHAMAFMKYSREWVWGFVGIYEKVCNYVHSENKLALKWLDWCGADFTTQIEINGELFFKFEIEMKNV